MFDDKRRKILQTGNTNNEKEKDATELRHERVMKYTNRFIAFLLFSLFFLSTELIDQFVLHHYDQPFFPDNFCLAFAELPTLSTPGADFSQCGPCNPFACPSPCPGGMCPEQGIVGNCPRYSATPPPTYGYGNTTDPQGPACPVYELTVSSGASAEDGKEHLCPTGFAPNFDLNTLPPPVVAAFNLKHVSGAEYCRQVCPLNLCGQGYLSDSQRKSLEGLHHLEMLYTCIGFTFTVIMGVRVLALWSHPKLFRPTLVLWLVVAWFMCQHYPHFHMHNFYSKIQEIIGLEYGFHLPSALCGVFVTRYVYKLVSMSSSWKPAASTGNIVKDVLKSVWFWPGVVGCSTAFIIFMVGRPKFKVYKFVALAQATDSQLDAIQIIDFFQACAFAAGFTFALGMIPIVRGLSTLRYQIEAYLYVLSVAWMAGNWQTHGMLHITAHIPFTPDEYMNIEWGYHFTIMLATLNIAYNTNKLIEMALIVSERDLAKGDKKVYTVAASKNSELQSTAPSAAPGGSTIIRPTVLANTLNPLKPNAPGAVSGDPGSSASPQPSRKVKVHLPIPNAVMEDDDTSHGHGHHHHHDQTSTLPNTSSMEQEDYARADEGAGDEQIEGHR